MEWGEMLRKEFKDILNHTGAYASSGDLDELDEEEDCDEDYYDGDCKDF